ncbi:hypothetical protein C9415_27250 [Kluyvera sp. Nf5]|nr:hypothetical protein C9415_27250 [Kluyvera sp. Nf5]
MRPSPDLLSLRERLTQPHRTPIDKINNNSGYKPALAGFFISAAIVPIPAANLPPPPIKKGVSQ